MPVKKVKYVYSKELIEQADKHRVVKQRASLTHDLISSFGILKHMEILVPTPCSVADLRYFHSADYIKILTTLCEEATGSKDAADSENDSVLSYDSDSNSSLSRPSDYGIDFDCPIWHGLLDYARSIAGATMTACNVHCHNKAASKPPELIINWTGGWHHAHRDQAAGYCYINDIVLGILVLRKCYSRILYLDLDAHHGDGVEEAFGVTKKVFTLSFHQYECGFYPGTGSLNDCGIAGGKGYAANFPYKRGISGANFVKYFKRVTKSVLDRFKPDICVLQCGGDCIVGDSHSNTNLTPADLIECIRFVTERDFPALILGGGGYNLPNLSRYWTMVTAALCDQQLDENILSDSEHFLCYGPDYSLHIKAIDYLKDENTEEYLEECVNKIEENLIKHDILN